MPSLIRPSSIDAERYLIWLFLRTEKKLVDEIARKQTSGYVDYAEQAALKRVQGTLKDLEDESFTYVPRMVRESFIKTNKDLYGYSNAEALARISEAQNKAIELLTENLLGTITEAVAQTYESAKELMMIGRLENDPFRNAVIQGAARSEALGSGSLTEAAKIVTELETKGITAFIDKAGRHWSLRDYGNMAIRTTKRQAEVSSLLTADDWDLWQIVKIGSTCPLCAVYEGRVYSKSGMNPNYPPLAMAFGKIDPAGGNDLSNTYLNIHPNCLHSLIKFTEMGKTDKQLQKIREFSSPITNPTNIDPRTKKERAAYENKVKNRAKLLREMRQKQAQQLERASKRDIIISGARITDPNSKDGEKFAETFYPEIRKRKTDVNKIAKNTGMKRSEIQKIKNYLFMDNSKFNDVTGKWEQFDSDCAIAQSWQRLTEGKNIQPHDLTLLRHEIYEMQIKERNPGIEHGIAHEIASDKYDYKTEVDAYYDKIKKHSSRE